MALLPHAVTLLTDTDTHRAHLGTLYGCGNIFLGFADTTYPVAPESRCTTDCFQCRYAYGRPPWAAGFTLPYGGGRLHLPLAH